MIIAYSGSTSGESLPEAVLFQGDGGEWFERSYDVPVTVMLTYWEIYSSKGDAWNRLKRHTMRERQRKERSRGTKSES